MSSTKPLPGRTTPAGAGDLVDATVPGLARGAACAILESGPGFGELGRRTILAGAPRATFEVVGRSWTLSDDWPGKRPPSDASPFAALRFLLARTRRPAERRLSFAGGWIGFLGYDLAPLLERLPRRLPPDGRLPDMYLGYHDAFAIDDVAEGTRELFAFDPFGEGELDRRRRLDRLERSLEPAPLEDDGRPIVQSRPTSDFSRSEYVRAVDRVLDYIRAGDIFQANLAQRFTATVSAAPELVHARCRRLSPAPFAAFLRHGDWAIVSSSPERFLLLEPDRRVETRPIKGTRPRGGDAIHDLLLKDDLAASSKDLAELTMIVDLERNDLGRVCDFGSIKVARHAEIESYANVHHLVSTVEGRLHDRFDAIDLIKAAFPGGSITGAPKIRAMQIIDELERRRRGVYTGAVGYFSDDGRADWNIAIRTLVLDGPAVHFHVGGGIVADSRPEAEWEETLAKGKKLFEVLLGDSA